MLYTGGYEPRTCTSSAFYPPCAFRLRTVFCERAKCVKRFARDHSRRALERPAHVGLVRGANRCTRRPPRRGSGETGYYVAGYSVASGEYRALRRGRKCRAAGGRGMWGRISLYDERGVRLRRRRHDHPLYPRCRFHGSRVAPCRNDSSSPTSICVCRAVLGNVGGAVLTFESASVYCLHSSFVHTNYGGQATPAYGPMVERYV